MNDNNQQVDRTDKVNSQHKISGKRRLFVKGAAGAVPAILTLKSGAAFALTSAEMCTVKDNGLAASQRPDVLADNDIWLRKEVECRLLDDGNSATPIIKVYPSPFDSTQWREEDYMPNPFGSGQGIGKVFKDSATIHTMKSIDGAGPEYTYTTEFHHVLVILDSAGKAIDLGKVEPSSNSNGLPYITGSCWTSAGPTASANGTDNLFI